MRNAIPLLLLGTISVLELFVAAEPDKRPLSPRTSLSGRSMAVHPMSLRAPTSTSLRQQTTNATTSSVRIRVTSAPPTPPATNPRESLSGAVPAPLRSPPTPPLHQPSAH